jgi:hypothetical protein
MDLTKPEVHNLKGIWEGYIGYPWLCIIKLLFKHVCSLVNDRGQVANGKSVGHFWPSWTFRMAQ